MDEVTLASRLENHERRIESLENLIKAQEEFRKSNSEGFYNVEIV